MDKRLGIDSKTESFGKTSTNFGQERNGGFPQLLNKKEFVTIHTVTTLCAVLMNDNQIQRWLFCESVCLYLKFPTEKCYCLGRDSFPSNTAAKSAASAEQFSDETNVQQLQRHQMELEKENTSAVIQIIISISIKSR